jgi:hypothetical protein
LLNAKMSGLQAFFLVMTGLPSPAHFPGICHAKGMTSFLYANAIRIFDYPKFAATLRGKVRENAAKVAEAAGISIEHIRRIKGWSS